MQAKKLLFSNSITGQADKIRDLAHSISDDIYYKLTKVKGIFSTKIAYVKANWVDNNSDNEIDDVTLSFSLL